MYKKILSAVIAVTFLFSCTGFVSATTKKTAKVKKTTVSAKKPASKTTTKKPVGKAPTKKIITKKPIKKAPIKKPAPKTPVKKPTLIPTPAPTATPEPTGTVTLTPKEKRAQGYLKKNTLGIEYKRDAALWLKYDENLDTYGPDVDPADLKSAIFDGRYVAYLSNEGLDQYYTALKIKDAAEKQKKIDEALKLEKMLWSLIVYRDGMVPSEAQIKKDLMCENALKLGIEGGYVFYYGYNNYNDSDLKGDSITAFKALYDDSMVIKDTMTIFKPISSEEGIKAIGNFKFKLKDILGSDVDESIFAKNNLTMVNIWGTFCGPCIREMPTLQKLTVDLKDKKFGILGIVSDAFVGDGIDPAIVKKAVEICDKAGVKYTSVLPDDTMKYDGLLSFVSGVPTSFFVDSKGNIVGSIRVGDGTYEDYVKLIDEIMASMK